MKSLNSYIIEAKIGIRNAFDECRTWQDYHKVYDEITLLFEKKADEQKEHLLLTGGH